jgi:hypothetical protein
MTLLIDTVWTLRNTTKQINGWELFVTLVPTVKFTVHASPIGHFRVNVSFVSWSTNVSVSESQLGPINVGIFSFLLNAAVLLIPSQSFVVPYTPCILKLEFSKKKKIQRQNDDWNIHLNDIFSLFDFVKIFLSPHRM